MASLEEVFLDLTDENDAVAPGRPPCSTRRRERRHPAMTAIYKRELCSYFNSMIGWGLSCRS